MKCPFFIFCFFVCVGQGRLTFLVLKFRIQLLAFNRHLLPGRLLCRRFVWFVPGVGWNMALARFEENGFFLACFFLIFFSILKS
uniref:Uncharacterized protein n=1 Tax=Ixodes ricinus TaxID=34613 RepID=A0A6B0TXP8_IXORI